MLGAKNLMVDIGMAKVPVAVFGKGKRNLIMLPGVGDGLQTAEGKALLLALSYMKFAKDFRVYVMSRRLDLPENFGTKEMAEDMKLTMDAIGIEKASVLGVSMGGMIAQHFAAAYPERTEKVILAVTSHKRTEEMKILAKEWILQAKNGDGIGLMKSSVRNMYTERYYRKNKWLCEVTGRFAVPKSYDRFIKLSHACLEHDAERVLGDIKAPVLIIGGGKDRTVGIGASREMAEMIPGAKLFIYEGFGHAVYDEAPDFNRRVLDFLNE